MLERSKQEADHSVVIYDEDTTFRHGMLSALRDYYPAVSQAMPLEGTPFQLPEPKPSVAVVGPFSPKFDTYRLVRELNIHGVPVIAFIDQAFPEKASGHLIALASLRGVHGYLDRACSLSEPAEAVSQVLKGDPYLSQSLQKIVIQTVLDPAAAEQLSDFYPNEVDKLTRRELEVAALIAKGYSNKIIANELGLSVNTVRAHLSRIYGKVETRSVDNSKPNRTIVARLFLNKQI